MKTKLTTYAVFHFVLNRGEGYDGAFLLHQCKTLQEARNKLSDTLTDYNKYGVNIIDYEDFIDNDEAQKLILEDNNILAIAKVEINLIDPTEATLKIDGDQVCKINYELKGRAYRAMRETMATNNIDYVIRAEVNQTFTTRVRKYVIFYLFGDRERHEL